MNRGGPDTDRFEPKSLAAPTQVDIATVVGQGDRLPRHRDGELFLRGPIQLAWLSRASGLGGKVLAVGLAIWFQAGITNKRTISLTGTTLSHFNVGRQAAYRALDALESAGLIQTDRANGRCARVTLIVNPE